MMYVVEIPDEIIYALAHGQDYTQQEPKSDLDVIKNCLRVGLRSSSFADWETLDLIIVDEVKQSETFGEYIEYRTPRFDILYQHRKAMWDALIESMKEDKKNENI